MDGAQQNTLRLQEGTVTTVVPSIEPLAGGYTHALAPTPDRGQDHAHGEDCGGESVWTGVYLEFVRARRSGDALRACVRFSVRRRGLREAAEQLGRFISDRKRAQHGRPRGSTEGSWGGEQASDGRGLPHEESYGESNEGRVLFV